MSLLVVGALHWDVVVRAERLPQLDETLRGQSVAYQFGGKGGNQAIAAARAGAQVAFAGRIGADDAGAAMRALLVSAGIDVSQLQTGTGASGMSAAIVTEHGDYGAVIVSAENHAFVPGTIALPHECRMLLLQNEMTPEILPALASRARRQSAQVVWNAAPAADVAASDLALIDTLIVNRVEAADLLGRANVETDAVAGVRALADRAPHAEIILTLGGGGVAFAAPGGPPDWQRALPVEVTSTHGAGDVFVGAFAAARLRGSAMSDAVAAGQEAAAAHISQIR